MGLNWIFYSQIHKICHFLARVCCSPVEHKEFHPQRTKCSRAHMCIAQIKLCFHWSVRHISRLANIQSWQNMQICIKMLMTHNQKQKKITAGWNKQRTQYACAGVLKKNVQQEKKNKNVCQSHNLLLYICWYGRMLLMKMAFRQISRQKLMAIYDHIW